MSTATTVLGYKPISKTLLMIAAALTVLFTIVQPAASQHLGFWSRLLFWAYHIGVGLLAIACASWMIRQHLCSKYTRLWNICFSGFLGIIIALPFYVVVDALFNIPDFDDADWLDQLESSGLPGAVAAEFIEVAPTFLAVWFAINLPLFIAKPQVNAPPPDDPGSGPDDEDKERQKLEQLKAEFFEKLPAIIGKELVSISSDLHYLNVTTKGGSALVLGSLKTYAPALSELGLQTHRSHWVAKAYVRKVHVGGDNAYCMMINGDRIPIARSKRKAVKDFFGTATLKSATVENKIVSISNSK